MAGTIRPDTITVSTSTPLISSKAPPSSTPTLKTAGKPTVSAQRIDLEPLYTALKSAIGDTDWAIYKESISLFVLGIYPRHLPARIWYRKCHKRAKKLTTLFPPGQLNQDELSRRIDTFTCNDPTREHLHNQFIAARYGNASRDSPEPGVASWVSANDKPTTIAKPATGDEAERRLKTEVMQLPRRERKRLKGIQEV